MTDKELKKMTIGFSPITYNVYFGILEEDCRSFKYKRKINFADKVNIRMAYEFLKKTDDEFKDILENKDFDIVEKYEIE